MLPDPGSRTVSIAIKVYIEDARQRALKDTSIRSYTKLLDHLKRFSGEMALSAVTVEHLAAFRSSRQVQPRTQRKEIEYLRAFLAFCVNRGWLLANPARQLKPPAVGDLATLPLSHAEVSRLLLACDQIRGMWSEDTPHVRHRARALVLCLLYSGLRISDVALLRGSALEDSGHLVLHTAKTGVPIKVLLHREAATALRALPAPGGNPAYFFWTGRGSVEHCAKSLGRTITRLGRIADVHAHPHRFRDTFAVELLSNGADIRTVQLLLGNESVRTTEKHYAHFVAAHQALLDSSFRTEAARPLPVHAQSNRRRNAK